PAMAQVRKYEAATERAMYKAMKEFRQLESELKATRIALPDEESASFEPEAASEEELAEVVAHSAPRTPPPSIQIPETIQFPTRRNLDTAPNFFGYQSNGLC